MTTLRNFEQLILVKQLFQDARDASSRGDLLSRTKAVILLDLAVDITLNNILLNLNPGFIIPKDRSDIKWALLWQEAASAMQLAKGTALTEHTELSKLHGLRNTVQHGGAEPAPSQVQRFVEAARRMLTAAFRDALDLDFENLRRWDFVTNPDLGRLLNESEEFLTAGAPTFCLIGCRVARRLILGALHKYTTRGRYESAPWADTDAKKDAYAIRHYAEFVTKTQKHTEEKIKNLESELILVGLGMPIIDTRRFIQFTGRAVESIATDGSMRVKFRGEPDAETETADAKFMLDYLHRLTRAVEEDEPDALKSITFTIPLTEQSVVKNYLFA